MKETEKYTRINAQTIDGWVEEGWDAEKNCAGAAYAYDDCVLTRDEEGNLLSEEIGNLFQAADGTWWIT